MLKFFGKEFNDIALPQENLKVITIPRKLNEGKQNYQTDEAYYLILSFCYRNKDNSRSYLKSNQYGDEEYNSGELPL